jgi:hypothetical protein
MNYIELNQAIQNYSENTESLFVESIPMFIQQAEERIYNTVQFPSLRKNVTGNTTLNNKYLSCPDDFLSVYSVAIVDATGTYKYLLNKDVNFLRESYPNPTDVGEPRYYALFGTQISNPNELSFIMAPTPNDSYPVELHYFYYPETIVQGIVLTLGTITGGGGYNNGVYANVPLTGGNGTFAVATIVISGGLVTQCTLTNGGSLYVVGDILSASNTYIGNSGAGFSVPVASINNATGTSWLGDNYDPVLFYGAMREAVIFMKGEQDMVTYYEKMYQDALMQAKRLGDGLERNDAYRQGQTSLPYKGL